MDDPFDRAIEYIRKSWKKGSTLKDIAARHQVDPGNLDRVFRKRVGMTVKVFIDQKRKLFVLTQVRQDRKFGYEIGSNLGFEDDLAFYRWVKRAFGVSFKQLHSIIGDRRNAK